MKRWIIMLFCLLFLTGCSGDRQPSEKDMQKPVRFYYCTEDDAHYGDELGALRWELRDLGSNDYSLVELINLFFLGPKTEGLSAPFPASLRAESAEIKDGVLVLELSSNLQDLAGMKRTLTAACLVHTMVQFDRIEAVKLTCSAGTMQGVLSKQLSPDDFLLLDDSATSDQTTVRIYFPDNEGRYLEEEIRERAFDSKEQIAPYVIRQLLAGPEEQGHKAVIPEDTRLNTLWIHDGVCSLDLSLDFVRKQPETHQEARMRVFSVVHSLTELSWIDCVQIQSGGQVITDYGGMDLSQPIYREEFAISQIPDDRLYDGVLCLACSEQEKLAVVPTIISRTHGRRLEADVLNALLTYEPANGYESPIPDGVVVTDLTVSNGICKVTFNGAFALCDTDVKEAEKAVRSVVGTLCSLENVEEVLINVSQAEIENVDLSEPIAPSPDWYLE